jgi:hypothetical protein
VGEIVADALGEGETFYVSDHSAYEVTASHVAPLEPAQLRRLTS